MSSCPFTYFFVVVNPSSPLHTHLQEILQPVVADIGVGDGLGAETCDGGVEGGGGNLVDGGAEAVVADEVAEEALAGTYHRFAVLGGIAYAAATLARVAVWHKDAVAGGTEGVEKLETYELVLHEYVTTLFLEPCQAVVERLLDVVAHSTGEVEPMVSASLIAQ